jgi:hypothetical protein
VEWFVLVETFRFSALVLPQIAPLQNDFVLAT